MPKVRHFLRKLHIGGGACTDDVNHHHDHHHHHQSPAVVVDQQSSSSASSSSSTATDSIPNANSSSGTDYNYFEEEFQMQLALAISVSDQDSRDDSETTLIKAAKKISLRRPPSQSVAQFISLNYWTHNVVNYNEKIVDGFYDVCGINSNSGMQRKMPLLVNLAAVSVSDNGDYEVILVNRVADMELCQLEERVSIMSRESLSLRKGPSRILLVQRIADLVVDRMGGPVIDTEDIMRRWTARSNELRISLNTIVLPLGRLDVGLSRHRALLFKVLADKVNLPCMLVKGSFYTGTDDGVVNLIKFDNGSEYIIDLMGAPGTLIPPEVPSSQLPNCGLDATIPTLVADNLSSSHSLSDEVTIFMSIPPIIDGNVKISNSSVDLPFFSIEPKGNCGSVSGNLENEHSGHELGNVIPLSGGISEGQSAAQEMQFTESEYVRTAAKNPEISQMLSAVLLETGASLHPNLFPDVHPHESREQRVVENQILKGGNVGSSQKHPEVCLSNNEQSLVSSAGGQLFADASNGSKSNPKGLGTQPKEVMSVVPHSGSSSLMDNTEGAQFHEVKAGKIFHNIEEEEIPTIRNMEIANSSKSDLCTVDNELIDPMLGEVAEWEIPFENLQIGERIGIGSYGEVYRSDWNGTEVAVKKFINQDISGDALAQFKSEVDIMLRLRHPNVVLFMGAVTRPPNLSILTEFLPRGSLYKILHRTNIRLEEKRRMRMALDVAKGMNYLHTSHPVIVHRDLKTLNLLVDKNWVVKVCDFGMSRMMHHTFLTSKSTAGTAEWMAPEVLRNEPSNEKSDVYSFGVILWELATLQVPWKGMHSMQVIYAVAYQGKRLDIPESIDPRVADLITDCWKTAPEARPSFRQIIARLKSLKHLEVPKAEICSDQPQG